MSEKYELDGDTVCGKNSPHTNPWKDFRDEVYWYMLKTTEQV